MKKSLLIFVIVLFASFIYAQNAWINELHYDNASTDVNEFIEVAIDSAGKYTLSDFTLSLYRDTGDTYDSRTLDQFTEGSTVDGFTFYTWNRSGIQNGPEDGMCLDYQGTVIQGQFLSYEGVLSATDGPASGMTSTDIGVEENGGTTAEQSLQLGGAAKAYLGFYWQSPLTATPGAINANQEISFVINPEPSSHVTGFAAGDVASFSMTLSWTGSTGAVLPSRYLIIGRKDGANFINVQDSVPVPDNKNWSDSTFAINVVHETGANELLLTNLDESTTYDFRIFPYTNYGDDINYKTDGTVPEASATTTSIPLTSIADIRQNMSTFMDSTVKVSGIVTYVRSGNGFFIQEAPIAWSGIYVYDYNAVGNFSQGDSVTIFGSVSEYNDLSQIIQLSYWKINKSGVNAKPIVVATKDFAQEQYESMLMGVRDAECLSVDVAGDTWQVDDSSGVCGIDGFFYMPDPPPIVGAYYNITGISNWYNSEFKLAPRSESDIELIITTPVIYQRGVSVRVPLAGEDFVDTVTVKAKNTLDRVDLFYRINGDDETLDSLSMTALPGDTLFYGQIPGSVYNAGNAVEYWVYAEDVSGEKMEQEHQGFFADTTGISSFKQWTDNTNLIYDKYYVRTTGVATVGDSIFSNTSMNFFIQDGSGGVNIFKTGAGEVDIIPGHQYTVTGMITQYAGVVEVMPDDPETDVVDEGESEMPQPIEVDMATLLGAGEELEGLLVRCMNVNIVSSEGNDPWPPAGTDENADILITDDGGTNQLLLHIDKDTNIPGTDEPSWPQHITGIFSQYDYSAPYTEGYQLIPRSISDFEIATALKDEITAIPDKLILYHAYPNPFNPATTISFNIPVKMVGEQVQKLTIYNTLGQVVKEYTLSNLKAGLNTVKWNGRSNDGYQVSSGLYFAVLQVSNLRQSTKLLLLK